MEKYLNNLIQENYKPLTADGEIAAWDAGDVEALVFSQLAWAANLAQRACYNRQDLLADCFNAAIAGLTRVIGKPRAGGGCTGSFDPRKSRLVTYSFMAMRSGIRNEFDKCIRGVGPPIKTQSKIGFRCEDIAGMDFARDPGPDEVEQQELVEILQGEVASMEQRESDMLMSRAGGQGYKEIAKRYGVTRQAIHKSHRTALKKLKKRLDSKIPAP